MNPAASRSVELPSALKARPGVPISSVLLFVVLSVLALHGAWFTESRRLSLSRKIDQGGFPAAGLLLVLPGLSSVKETGTLSEDHWVRLEVLSGTSIALVAFLCLWIWKPLGKDPRTICGFVSTGLFAILCALLLDRRSLGMEENSIRSFQCTMFVLAALAALRNRALLSLPGSCLESDRSKLKRAWTVAAAGLVAGASDERFQIHERVGGDYDGFLLLGLGVAAVALALWFLRPLARTYRPNENFAPFVLALALLVGISAALFDLCSFEEKSVKLAGYLEELLEIQAAMLLLCAFCLASQHARPMSDEASAHRMDGTGTSSVALRLPARSLPGRESLLR